jgi:hypothetical protein
MVGCSCRIGLLSLPLLMACGYSADYDAVPDGGAIGASVDETPASDTEAESPSVESPCFRNPDAEAWRCDADGMTLTRTRAGTSETAHCAYGCVSLPDGFDSQCRPRDGELGNTVNRHALSVEQASWVSYFAWCAVPMLKGTRDARLTAASTVAWWALKEGVLDASRSHPVGLSLCRTNRVIGPLDTCAVRFAWQVGASGVQASCCSLNSVASTAATLFPGMTEDELLSGAAVEAGYPIGSAENRGIVGSAGALRASWLLHVTAIGFLRQGPIVTDECIATSRPWCFGTRWAASSSYAPDKPSAMRAIRDLRRILDLLSP